MNESLHDQVYDIALRQHFQLIEKAQNESGNPDVINDAASLVKRLVADSPETLIAAYKDKKSFNKLRRALGYAPPPVNKKRATYSPEDTRKEERALIFRSAFMITTYILLARLMGEDLSFDSLEVMNALDLDIDLNALDID